jgi:DNA-binding transcriptional MocR family regulator
LRRHLPALTFTGPAGGYFIWAQLPPGEAATSVLARAAAQRVSFQPGIKFSSQQGLPYHLRFSFAYYGPAELQEGVRRLAQVIR